ncbi:MAG: RNHCP domain-containing protein, partial [Myxococcota bacterium]|nr:RNHCP domain-containing protein [Myxococcota bacterium]
GEDLRASDPAQKLLRRAAGREAAARQRKNPIVRNEAFECMECSFDVPPLAGGGVRNHCPRCLTSRHVDGPVPGDRSARCGGPMRAEQLEQLGGIFRVTHRCLRCGFTRRNRLYPDRLPEPDRLDSLQPGGPAGPGGA